LRPVFPDCDIPENGLALLVTSIFSKFKLWFWKGKHLLRSNQVHSPRGVTIHFFHKRYLICITIRFIGNCNCNYSLKSMPVDMNAAILFFIWGRLGQIKSIVGFPIHSEIFNGQAVLFFF
jgi:hypothetical protein